MADDEGEIYEFKLKENSELRFEVEAKSKIVMTILDGFAEMFGTELCREREYIFQGGQTTAVYTWHGCEVRLKGRTEVAYTSTDSPMIIYLNNHVALEQMRQKAEETGIRGPRAMIVGPQDVGKSTLCRILLNYAVRMGRAPIFVDLDVGQGEISVPTTLGANLVERPADIDEGFSLQAPLVFHYGHTSPAENLTLYNHCISKLAAAVELRCRANRRACVGGVIVNACGWIRGGGYQSILYAVKEFEIDIVIVLDQERLFKELERDLPKFVKCVLQPKSGGVIERTPEFRTDARQRATRKYFNGAKGTLFPHSFDVKLADIKLYKVGVPNLASSCLPAGMKAEEHSLKLVPIKAGSSIMSKVFSVSMANSPEEVVDKNVCGFVVIQGVDLDRGTITVLSPSPRPLPKSILLQTDVHLLDVS